MIHYMFLMKTEDFTCDSCLQKNDLNQTKGQDHEDTDGNRPITGAHFSLGGYKDLSGSASGQHRVNQPIKLKHLGLHTYSEVFHHCSQMFAIRGDGGQQEDVGST